MPAGSEPVEGRITHISGVAGAGARSFRIEAEVANPTRDLAAGMSATLQIPLEKVSAHFTSPALLTPCLLVLEERLWATRRAAVPGKTLQPPAPETGAAGRG